MHELLKRVEENGRGLTARYLMSWPKSNVGRRPTDLPDVDEELEAAWDELIERLASDAFARDEPVHLQLSAQAKKAFRTWKATHEPKLRATVGELSGVVEWANKLPGQVARLALVLHVGGEGKLSGEISEQTMENAIRLSDYFCSHTLHIYGSAKADERTKDAVVLLDRLRKEGEASTSVRELTRKTHWEADRVREGLQVLSDHDWVRVERHQDGGRPSEVVQIHPSAISDQQNPVTKVTKVSEPEPFVTFVTAFSGFGN